MPFRLDTIEIPTPGRPGHLFPPSAPPSAEDDVRGFLSPLVRAGRIFTSMSSSLIFTSLPRDRIYIRRIIMAASYGETMKIFRERALTSRDDHEERGECEKTGMNTKLIVFRAKCVHVYEPAVTTSCICTLKGPFASLLSVVFSTSSCSRTFPPDIPPFFLRSKTFVYPVARLLPERYVETITHTR